MKGIQIKQIVKSISVVFFILVMIISCTRFNKQINSNTEIPLMIKSDPAVLDAKIIFDDSYLFFESDLYIYILFCDGSNIKVDHVNEFGKGKTMKIQEVNNYSVSIVNKVTGVAIDWKQQLKFFSVLIGEDLETVMDIVKNYRVICSKIENWVNLSEYKQDNEEIYETKRRILAENTFLFPDSIIKFNEQEYFVYKEDRSVN